MTTTKKTITRTRLTPAQKVEALKAELAAAEAAAKVDKAKQIARGNESLDAFRDRLKETVAPQQIKTDWENLLEQLCFLIDDLKEENREALLKAEAEALLEGN